MTALDARTGMTLDDAVPLHPATNDLPATPCGDVPERLDQPPVPCSDTWRWLVEAHAREGRMAPRCAR
jgi:hypothetical protein